MSNNSTYTPPLGGFYPNQTGSNNNEGDDNNSNGLWSNGLWSNGYNNSFDWWSNGNNCDMSEAGTTLLGMETPCTQQQYNHFNENTAPDEMDVDNACVSLSSEKLEKVKIISDVTNLEKNHAESILNASNWNVPEVLVNVSLSMNINLTKCSDTVKQEVVDYICSSYNSKSYETSAALIQYKWDVSNYMDNLTKDTPGGPSTISANTLKKHKNEIKLLRNKFPSLAENIVWYILATNGYNLKQATMVAQSLTTGFKNKNEKNEQNIEHLNKIKHVCLVTRLPQEQAQELLKNNKMNLQLALNNFYTTFTQRSKYNKESSESMNRNREESVSNELPPSGPKLRSSNSSIEMISKILTDTKKQYQNIEQKEMENVDKTKYVKNYYGDINNGTINELVNNYNFPMPDLNLGKQTPVEINRYVKSVSHIHVNILKEIDRINKSSIKTKHNLKIQRIQILSNKESEQRQQMPPKRQQIPPKRQQIPPRRQQLAPIRPTKPKPMIIDDDDL